MHHFLTIIEKLRKFAPLELAESWDNVGLLVDCISSKSPPRILLTNDYTDAVFNECISKNVGLVISYHPPIFTPLKAFRSNNPKENLLIRTIQAGISIFSPHTALDCCTNGINDWLASAFSSISFTSNPIKQQGNLNTNVGMGRILTLQQSISIDEAVTMIKNKLNITTVRLASPFKRTTIKTIALCAGSGSSLFKDCSGIDLFVTGEAGHHFALECVEHGSYLILTEHSNSERGFLNDVLKTVIGEDCIVSDADKEPFQTL